MITLKILGLIAAIAAVVVGWVAVEDRLVAYASDRHAAVVGTDQVVVDAPRWMSPAVRDRIGRVVSERLGEDPMDAAALARAAGALADDPWVAAVDQLWRGSDGSVHVRAAYRQPVAVVRGRDGYHLVDAEGVRLPGVYEQHQLPHLGLPRVTGLTTAGPYRPGQAWAGADLAAALALVRLVRDEPYADQVQAIDTSRRDGRGRLRLVIDTQAGQVFWGLPAGQEIAIEPDAPVKLARLRQVYARYGRIDGGGRLVRVYGPTTKITRAPLRDAVRSAQAP